MNSAKSNSRLVYVYAEYCPGDFYWGWWLYYCGIRYGLPDRNNRAYHNGRVWLNYDWQIRQLFSLLGLPYRIDYRHEKYAEWFMDEHPQGIVLKLSSDGCSLEEFYFPTDVELNGIYLGKLFRRVRELQLLDWKHGNNVTNESRLAVNLRNKWEVERVMVLQQ